MTWLPDINVWLALAVESHIHHDATGEWFENLGNGTAAFSRMTQQGFLRLASNAKVLESETLSMNECWNVYDALLSDDRVGFLTEPALVESKWRTFTQNDSFSPKIWNDAYLAAFAICSGLELVTFDKGFRRYEGLDFRLLE